MSWPPDDSSSYNLFYCSFVRRNWRMGLTILCSFNFWTLGFTPVPEICSNAFTILFLFLFSIEFCTSRGLSRFDIVRQSIYSTASSTSWDRYSFMAPSLVTHRRPGSDGVIAAHKKFVRQSMCEADRESMLSDSFGMDDSYADLSYADSSSVGACSMDDRISISNRSEQRMRAGTPSPRLTHVDGASGNSNSHKFMFKKQNSDSGLYCSGAKNSDKLLNVTKQFFPDNSGKKVSTSSQPELQLNVNGYPDTQSKTNGNSRYTNDQKVYTHSESIIHGRNTKRKTNERYPFSASPLLALKQHASESDVNSGDLNLSSNKHTTVITVTMPKLRRSRSSDQVVKDGVEEMHPDSDTVLNSYSAHVSSSTHASNITDLHNDAVASGVNLKTGLDDKRIKTFIEVPNSDFRNLPVCNDDFIPVDKGRQSPQDDSPLNNGRQSLQDYSRLNNGRQSLQDYSPLNSGRQPRHNHDLTTKDRLSPQDSIEECSSCASQADSEISYLSVSSSVTKMSSYVYINPKDENTKF